MAFIHFPYPDYLAAFTLHGLIQELGRENVLCFPLTYYDTPQENSPEFLKVCFQGLGHQEDVSLDDFCDRINANDFDYVFISRAHWFSDEVLKPLLEKTTCRFVVIDDDSKVLHSLCYQTNKLLEHRVMAYFMKEKMYADESVLPLQFSLPEEELLTRSIKKEFSFSFIARITQVSYEFRNALVEVLKGIGDSQSFIHWDTEPLTRQTFLDVTQKSFVSISALGERFDCPRFYEIPANYSLCLSNRLLIDCWKPFVHEQNVLFFNSVNDIEDLLYTYLKNPEKCDKMARAGHNHLKRFHTTRRRAQYIMDSLEKFSKNY